LFGQHPSCAAGVVGVISPWNSPIDLTMCSLGLALVSGRTSVIRLPGQTAHLNALLAEVVAETTDLPRGVVNVVTGDWRTARLLIESPDVSSISVTGTTRTSRAPRRLAPFQRFGIELAGATPMVVLESADLETAVPVLTKAVTAFAGQFCTTGNRILAARSIAVELAERLTESLARVRVGSPLDPLSELGPLIDASSVARLDRVVEQELADGAHVLVHGGGNLDGPLGAGAFYSPTLLQVDAAPRPLVRKQVVGPVVRLETFEDEADAIVRAADGGPSPASSVWGRDADQLQRIARKLRAGVVWINDRSVVDGEGPDATVPGEQAALGLLAAA
jgi:betaine-aldehyde dehydrogenase